MIQRKVIKGAHLPGSIKEIQVGYLISPYFKDIYVYLAHNKLPYTKAVIRKTKPLAERYILLDSSLFTLGATPERETALLVIPETCADRIISSYLSSPFAGYQGKIKTYLTIGFKFFIPGFIHHLRSYIRGCHICQL